MRLSYISQAATHEIPQSVELMWDEFCEANAEHVTDHGFGADEDAKKRCPLFSPAEFVPDASRHDSNVIRLHMAVLDADEISDAELATLLDAISPYDAFVYTSWKHHKTAHEGKHRVRVCFPLTRTVSVPEWPAFWSRLVVHFGNMADGKCGNPSRFYFEPYAPPGTDGDNWTLRNEGAPLDVDVILALPAPDGPVGRSHGTAPTVLDRLKSKAAAAPVGASGPLGNAPAAPPPESEVLTKSHLSALELKLKRRASAHAHVCADALHKIQKGLDFAEEGARDDTLFRVIGELLRAYPTLTADSVCELLRPSLELMAARKAGAPTLDVVRDKIAREREIQAQVRAVQGTQRDAELSQRIREAFQGTREAPYTPQEIEALAQDAGLTVAEFRKHWIYQKGLSYYLRVGEDIRGPKVKGELTKCATVLLAPATTAGVDTYTLTPQGQAIPKSPEQLVEDYGTPVAQVTASLIAQASYYDRATSSIVEAVCPIRKDLDPHQDAEVSEWLECFAGDNFERLNDWLALLPDLSEPLPALYLDGPPGAGKSLFAEGIARLWTTDQATKLEVLAKSFNSQITSCPVAFADEYMPAEYKGDKGTGRLRELIAGRSRPLTRKYLPDATLVGAIRLVIAGNNDSLISAEEQLTENDIQAIVDRILYLEIAHEASAYLACLPDLGKSFRFGDRIARHVLWLSQNRAVVRQGRFGIRGEAGKLHRTLTVSSGSRSAVCNWLAGALAQWDSLTSRAKIGRALRVTDSGELWVNAAALVEGWNVVTTNAKPPSTRKIGQAVSSLSDNRRVQHKGINFRVIRLDLLAQWCDETGYMSGGEVRDAIARIIRSGSADVDRKTN